MVSTHEVGNAVKLDKPRTGFSQPIRLFGHRGAAGEAPENTLGGFAYAWETGVRAFELDIHLSRDSELVVIHDPTLERTTHAAGWVGDHTTVELNSLNAACRFPGWPDREGIPSLQDVLNRYHKIIAHWQLEIKTDGAERLEVICKLLADQISRHQLSGRVTVTSFDPLALEIAHRTTPHLRLGLICGPRQPVDISLAKSLGCAELCINVKSGSATLVAAAQQAGLQVTGWLGNSQADLERLLDWEVESITTDVPAFAIPYLAARGRWSENTAGRF
jgi:glycerophosphoryl diester phosphodiesterase